MYVSGISAAEGLAPPRDRARDAHADARHRSGFSARHVIIDLSAEALRRIGQVPAGPALAQTVPLFVYDDTGSFAYGEAATRYEEARRRSPTLPAKVPALIEEPAILETPPPPRFVAFDGRLNY